MPPKRGIVKSGNAGNSSKPQKPVADAQGAQEKEKPLFPPGYKYPLSLLTERVQKSGWEKPVVDTYRRGDGFSFAVTLARINKKNERETVRLEPHPPCVRPTAIEARHWGATYALYRFCSGIQLNRVLPPGPREYWNELADEHKKAPEHQMWMYKADPFEARKAVDERQEKAAKKKEVKEKGSANQGVIQTSPEFAKCPEARMASGLRDLVEDSIKQAIQMYPEAEDVAPSTLEEDQIVALQQQLQTLGFTAMHAQQAITAFSTPSPLTSALIRSLGSLQACIEYLILHVPECDLPQRFLPSVNSSNPFVSSAHAGTEDIKTRWKRDKAVKECGWPEHIVEEYISQDGSSTDWRSLLRALNNRLIGLPEDIDPEEDQPEEENIDDDELEAYQARYVEEGHLEMPLPVAPIKLHILLDSKHSLPVHGRPPPMYITSQDTAAYVRLHLLSRVLSEYRGSTLVQPGESVIMAIVSLLEEEWAVIQDEGPPEMSQVLRHMLPSRPVLRTGSEENDTPQTATVIAQKERRRAGGPRKDDKTDIQVKADSDPKYQALLKVRQRLPAFASKDRFLETLAHNRCVIVVGETGCGKTTQRKNHVRQTGIDLLTSCMRASLI